MSVVAVPVAVPVPVPVPVPVSRQAASDHAMRVAVVAALSATVMLFASLVSAYLVRRSFEDWRPAPALWPLVLLTFGLLASVGIEVACRAEGVRRRAGFIALALASPLYFLSAVAVIASTVSGPRGLAAPHDAFVALLLGVHALHAVLGAVFAIWALRDAEASWSGSGERFVLARLVTHFLTALLLGILFVLFVLR